MPCAFIKDAGYGVMNFPRPGKIHPLDAHHSRGCAQFYVERADPRHLGEAKNELRAAGDVVKGISGVSNRQAGWVECCRSAGKKCGLSRARVERAGENSTR